MKAMTLKFQLKKQLKFLKDNEFIDSKSYYYLKPTDSHVSRFYGQPKTRKPRVPICPTVSHSVSPLYNLNKYIAKILKASIEYDNNSFKNSTIFSNYNRNVSIEDDGTIVSFDIISLRTNISIIDALKTIKDYVNNDDQFTRKTAIHQDKF